MRIIVSRNFTRNLASPGFCDHGMAYVLGLRALGHEVYVLDEVEPDRVLTDDYRPVSFEDWHGRSGFEALMRRYGVWPDAALVYDGGKATHGLTFRELARVADGADLLIVISGRVRTPEVIDAVRRRAYVDINPGKTQVYYAQWGTGAGYDFDRYDDFFTVGLNIGRPECELPAAGIDWHPIRPPVFLPLWPMDFDERCEAFTTVSTWAGRHTFTFGGVYSGEKSDEWLALRDLPRRTDQPLEVALRYEDGYRDQVQAFATGGWRVVDASTMRSFDDYRAYIASSRAELTAAHGRYVRFNTGWFSDRSARYLAAGKPVLTQSTGFEQTLPTGQGLLSFRTDEEAAEGIDRINADYRAHCDAARALAEELFDARKVVAEMLDRIGSAAPTRVPAPRT